MRKSSRASFSLELKQKVNDIFLDIEFVLFVVLVSVFGKSPQTTRFCSCFTSALSGVGYVWVVDRDAGTVIIKSRGRNVVVIKSTSLSIAPSFRR